MDRICPKCGMSNPPTAERCVCGHAFSPLTPQQLNDPAAEKKQPPAPRIAFIAGIVAFSIMTIQGIISTLNPRPDGRLLNTAPAIGFDIFLLVGLLGNGYCVVMLLRSR
jgi:hypothetical protein